MLHLSSRLIAAAAALAIAPLASAAPPSPEPDETRADEAALRAIVKHWDRAESDGDVPYLSQLLAPEYRSIGKTGEAVTRAALLAHAEQTHGSAEAQARRRKQGEEFLRTHPTEMAVAIHGPVGIVAYYNPTRGVDHSVRGSDVFVYEASRWHAIYSLHNGAE
ncbi:MAG TPA: DUF4440 domain-containing protein [Kofleriaceae bacterium]|jgi:hypothetical protein|nr:DUF4440 domain-containing protein [Kofleriaceae bacterium]